MSYAINPTDLGVVSKGVLKITATNGNYQHYKNAGGHTLKAPTSSVPAMLDILLTNVAGAGAVAFQGFHAMNPRSDKMTTTLGDRFILQVRCYSRRRKFIQVVALQ